MTASKAALWAPKRGEIIYIDYDPQAGEEMPGEHPMLVLSEQSFALRTSIVVGFPLTHANRHETNPFAIKKVWPDKEVSYLLAHQIKSFDWQKRGARRHPRGGGHTQLLSEAMALFNDIFNVCDC